MTTTITHQCDCCKKVYSEEEAQAVGIQTLGWNLQWKAGKSSIPEHIKHATRIDICLPCLEVKKLLRPADLPSGKAPERDYFVELADNLMRVLEDRIAEIVKEHLPNQ